MAYAAGNIVDFIRGFGERRRQAQIDDAMTNYMADPGQAIQQISQIRGGLPTALELQDRLDAEKNTARTAEQAGQTRYLGAVRNMATMLARARQEGGDIGAAYDSIAPALQRGLGFSDEELADWRQRITENPDILSSLSADAERRLLNIAPGGAAIDPVTGDAAFRNPTAQRSVLIRRGDGGSDAYVFDPSTGVYSRAVEGQVPPTPTTPGDEGSADTPAPAAPAGGGGGPVIAGEPIPGARGTRNNNPLNMRVPGRNEFRTFSTPAEGAAATRQQLNRYFSSGRNTPMSVVNGTSRDNPGWLGWPTPDNENTPQQRQNYIAHIAQRLGIGINDRIPNERIPELMTAMAEAEGSNRRPTGAGGSGQAQAGPAAAGGRGQPISTPGRPPNQSNRAQWRTATREEKIASGLDPDTPYQVNSDGQFQRITERPAGRGRGPRAELSGQMLQMVDSQHAIVERSIEQAIRDAGPSNTGTLGAVLRLVPGTPAYTYSGLIDTIRANIGFDRLQQMRMESPTGGALGQVAVRELEFLQSVLGNLDPNQERGQLVRNLRQVQQHYRNLRRALQQDASHVAEGTVIVNPETRERRVYRNGRWVRENGR